MQGEILRDPEAFTRLAAMSLEDTQLGPGEPWEDASIAGASANQNGSVPYGDQHGDLLVSFGVTIGESYDNQLTIIVHMQL